MFILEIILLTSLASFGFHVITREGYILGVVEAFWERGSYKAVKHIRFLSKPFSECPPCMGSLWGVAGYLALSSGFDIWHMIIVCLSVSTINAFLSNKIEY